MQTLVTTLPESNADDAKGKRHNVCMQGLHCCPCFLFAQKRMAQSVFRQGFRTCFINIEKMIKAGYFKDSREIDKTYKFMEEGIIPKWLLEDMKKYGYEDNRILIDTTSTKMLNTGGGKNDN